MRETIGNTGFVTLARLGRIAHLRFDRADSKVNALSTAAMRDLIAAARAFEDDAGTAVVVLSGKPQVFSGGFDLRDAGSRALDPATPLAERRVAAEVGARLVEAWWRAGPVTVAAIDGPCIGGGLALATALDFRVAGRGARFAAPEIARGLAMGWGSLPRIAAVIGVQATRRVVLAGAELDAEAALAAGLADRLADAGAAEAAALAFAEDLAAQPAAQLRMAKRTLNAAALDGAAAVALDVDQTLAAAASPEFLRTLREFGR